MDILAVASITYRLLIIVVLVVHVLFIAWVVLGVFVTQSRPWLVWLHIVSSVWGVVTEFNVPCPMTLLENWIEQRGGIEPYHDGFLMHYLQKLVYPDLPASWLLAAAVSVCVLNLGYYAWLMSHANRANA